MHRVGIIPFDTQGSEVALMFVTSQTRGRWVFPKGCRSVGESHIETCVREGFEEAGVRGILLEDFPMTVLITKSVKVGRVTRVPVTYYPFLVTEQVDDWPEKHKRQRHWALIEDAPRVAYRDDFGPLIEMFRGLLPWITEAAEADRPAPPERQTQAR